MRERMKMRLTKKPFERKRKVTKSISANEYLKKRHGDLPDWAIALRGLRSREGLSQIELGEFLGINQANISKMEHGKRPIGKILAKKLATFFKIDYRLFL